MQDRHIGDVRVARIEEQMDSGFLEILTSSQWVKPLRSRCS